MMLRRWKPYCKNESENRVVAQSKIFVQMLGMPGQNQKKS